MQLGVAGRSSSMSAVFSPRSAPISTIRRAPDARIAGAMTVFQNGNMGFGCRRIELGVEVLCGGAKLAR